jgi:Skp family chaperone for outer membrane proteins
VFCVVMARSGYPEGIMKTSLLTTVFAIAASSAFAQQTTAPARGRATAAPPAAAQPAPPTAPLPAGAKIAYVNVQYIAGNSAEGKAATAKVNALVAKKQAEGATQKTQEAAQKFQQDAQAEVQKLQTDLQGDFQRKLFPILQQMAQEKHLSMLLSAADAGLIWAEPGLDLTAEAMKRLDALTASAKK